MILFDTIIILADIVDEADEATKESDKHEPNCKKTFSSDPGSLVSFINLPVMNSDRGNLNLGYVIKGKDAPNTKYIWCICVNRWFYINLEYLTFSVGNNKSGTKDIKISNWCSLAQNNQLEEVWSSGIDMNDFLIQWWLITHYFFLIRLWLEWWCWPLSRNIDVGLYVEPDSWSNICHYQNL